MNTRQSSDIKLAKAHFEKNGKLYLEILTTDGRYKYAYLDEQNNMGLADSIEGILPVELPVNLEGELAIIVKMPDEGIATSRLLSPPELLHKIKMHILKYCDLPELDIELCCYYALFTWFYRKCNTVGYLRFLADTGKGKSRLLTIVGDICFYPIKAAGSSSFSGMMRTKERWHGTLITDEADTRGDKEARFVKYLNLGFEEGKYFILSDKQDPKQQEVFNPFGPKILAMREPFRDNATEGRLLSISPHETRNDEIPIILGRGYEEATRELRNEIARFVLAHWPDVDGERMLSFRGMGIEPRLQQLAMPLSIIFQLWEDGNERFKAYLVGRQKELKRERAQSWDGSVFNLVYGIAKGDEQVTAFASFSDQNDEIQAVAPSMIAKLMNTSTKGVTDTMRRIGFDVELRYIRVGQGTKKRVRAYVVSDEKTWEEIIQRYYCDDPEDGTDGTDRTLHYTQASNHEYGTGGTYPFTHNETPKIPEVLKSRKYLENCSCVLSSVPSVPSVPTHESFDEATQSVAP